MRRTSSSVPALPLSAYLGALALAAVSTIAGCQPKPVATEATGTTPAAATQPSLAATPTVAGTLPASQPGDGPLLPPGLSDLKPTDYPGLHNVVAYAKDVYSGSVPEGSAGFDTLKRLGIKTIISVDGAEPEVSLATDRGMRYVHLPITYGGMTEERKLEIAKAIRDLPKPVYVHCHHGKHRSAGAAGAAMVTLGEISADQAVARMKVSGTAPDYKGLYSCAANARSVLPAVLDAVSGDFPQVSKPKSVVKLMVEVDAASDNLKQVQKAGWKSSKSTPNLQPAAEAGRLADNLRILTQDAHTKSLPPEYARWMIDAMTKADKLEEGLLAATAAPPAELDKCWQMLQTSCKQCHVKYRD